MSSREWVSLLFKLSGIVILILGFLSAPGDLVSILSYWGEFEASLLHRLLLVSTVLIPFAVGAALLGRTDWFVDRAFKAVLLRVEGENAAELDRNPISEAAAVTDVEEESGTERQENWVLDFPSLHRDDIQAIAISLIGVWLLASAIPDFVYYFAEYLHFGPGRVSSYNARPFSDNVLPLLHVTARLLLGLGLFFRSFRIVKAWSRSENRVRITAEVAEWDNRN